MSGDYVSITIVYDEEKGEQTTWEVPVGLSERVNNEAIVRHYRPTLDGPAKSAVYPCDRSHKQRIGGLVVRAKQAGLKVLVS